MKTGAKAVWLEVDGKVLLSENAQLPLPMASLTKMMTALILLERTALTDEVTVSAAAARETGGVMGLEAGEKLRVADLLAGAVMASANDAARALADHLSGTEERFVPLMNEKARELGLLSTRFENSTGHDAENHYSTARDLALLAKTAMANPWYAALASRARLTVRSTSGRVYTLNNKNELVGRYQGAVGVKSGTTPKAGKSLAAMAQRDGSEALLILLGAKERWYKAEELLTLAFESKRAKSR